MGASCNGAGGQVQRWLRRALLTLGRWTVMFAAAVGAGRGQAALVDTIIFHHPMDADRAVWLMRSLDDRQAVTLPVQAGARTLQFGDHVFVIGVWGGLATGDQRSALEELVRMIAPARRRGVLVAWKDAQAAAAMGAKLGVPSVAASGHAEEDLKLVREVARSIERGVFVASDVATERAPVAAAAGRPAPSLRAVNLESREAPLPQRAPLAPNTIAPLPRQPGAPANDPDQRQPLYAHRKVGYPRERGGSLRVLLWLALAAALVGGGAAYLIFDRGSLLPKPILAASPALSAPSAPQAAPAHVEPAIAASTAVAAPANQAPASTPAPASTQGPLVVVLPPPQGVSQQDAAVTPKTAATPGSPKDSAKPQAGALANTATNNKSEAVKTPAAVAKNAAAPEKATVSSAPAKHLSGETAAAKKPAGKLASKNAPPAKSSAAAKNAAGAKSAAPAAKSGPDL